MPNWVTNELVIEGSETDIENVIAYIQDEEEGKGTVDFNRITPMPKWVYGNSPDVIGISTEDTRRLGHVNTSLGFATTHWGTKWNATSGGDWMEEPLDRLYFETAWSGVPYLFYKLAVLFPTCTLTYRFADEDLGNNVGHLIFNGTNVEDLTPPFHSKEAMELAFELSWGGIPDEYEWSEEHEEYILKEE